MPVFVHTVVGVIEYIFVHESRCSDRGPFLEVRESLRKGEKGIFHFEKENILS